MTGASSLTVYPTDSRRAALVLGHGAGAGQHSRFMVQAAQALSGRGIVTATFDFPYVIAGRKVPDRPPILEAAWRDAIQEARSDPAFRDLPLVIGGKSMGGRIASQVAASGIGIGGVRGLVFLGYPLHPPGKPEQRRDRHLPDVRLPMLFVQGSRDEFGTAEEIRALIPSLRTRADLYGVEGGDHSFKVPARLATPDAVLAHIFDIVASFVFAHTGQTEG